MWDTEQTATLTECKEEPEDEYVEQVEGCSSNSIATIEPVDHPSKRGQTDGQQIVIADDDEIAPNYFQPKFNLADIGSSGMPQQQQQQFQMFYPMQNNQAYFQNQPGQWFNNGDMKNEQQQAWQAS